jgi:hypothetical protein
VKGWSQKYTIGYRANTCNKHRNTQCDYIKIMQQGHKADHSFPSGAEVKKFGAIPPLPHTL